MALLSPKTLMTCPHCAKGIEGEVDDYVIPGRIGSASRTVHECEWCEESFSVEVTITGDFKVEKTTESSSY